MGKAGVLTTWPGAWRWWRLVSLVAVLGPSLSPRFRFFEILTCGWECEWLVGLFVALWRTVELRCNLPPMTSPLFGKGKKIVRCVKDSMLQTRNGLDRAHTPVNRCPMDFCAGNMLWKKSLGWCEGAESRLSGKIFYCTVYAQSLSVSDWVPDFLNLCGILKSRDRFSCHRTDPNVVMKKTTSSSV